MPLQEELEQQGNWLFKRRGFLPILFFIAGTIVYIQDILKHSAWIFENNKIESFYIFFCFLISFIGLVVRVFTVGFTAENTSGRNTKGQVADSINTSGIYSMLRHPLYLGNFFMWLGVAMATGNGWFICAFIFLYVIYYERIMFAEEQYLRKKYGEAYIQWAVKVPAIIPDFFHYKKNKLCFSGKKVFKQEKTGFLLLFLVFLFFNIIKTTLELKKFTVVQSFYFYGFLFSLIGYIILKYLQKKTHVLDEEIR